MIEKLSIKNVALIDSAEIEFSSGLNVLSGETGAGKSVILDSINFVLGAKADKTMIRHGETECFVRAVFRIPETSEAIKALEEMDIESDGLVVVSRKLNDVGKSSIKINGVPVSATMLRQVTSHLVDVHGQSEHFYLLKEANQLKVLDKAVGAEATSLKAEIAKHRGDRRELIEKIRSLGGDEAERERKIDVFRFQIEEIERVNPVDGEEEELLAKQNKLNHMERIVEAVQLASSYLNDERGALNAIAEAKRAIGGISKYDGAYDELCERLESLRVDAEDIGETLSDLEQSTYYDEEEANAVDSRLDALKMIKRKYGGSIEAALAFLQSAKEELALLLHCDEEVEKCSKALLLKEKELFAACEKLTALRKEKAADLEKRIVAELSTLNIKHASFQVEFRPYTMAQIDEAGAEGLDQICFLFSANAGEPLKPLGKIISGGEMSRFMLSVKTQLSDVNEISTYIFDEIDAGISGVTASVVAKKFAQIARNTQIIAVSHLAQIAAMSDRELLIEKVEEEGKTHTLVRILSKEEQVREIMRLIGGGEESNSAKVHALSMLQECEKYKKLCHA